ncbi:MAG: recombination regulator RecX [Bifidobacteriaceae bacterium]|jgi:regulatory protein|nr:recombination regulator RecX [Bifidobacteriaceae bacterium]
MKVDTQEEFARSIALKALDGAPRSRVQLEEILEKKGVPPEAVQHVLDRFEAVGLVDDQALADMLVRTRHSERGLVGPALAAELRRKGIPPPVAAAALEQVTSEDQLAAAERLAAKKLAATQGLPEATRLRRTVALLARKGYPAGLAFETTKRLLEAQ